MKDSFFSETIAKLAEQFSYLESDPSLWLNPDYSYRTALDNYPLDEISQYISQYIFFAQKWLNSLLEQLTKWENRKDREAFYLLYALSPIELCPIHLKVSEQEYEILNEQYQYLKQLLGFSLSPTKQKLTLLLEQIQQIEHEFEIASLQELTELHHRIPSFTLLVDHSLTICTKSLKHLEWLYDNIEHIDYAVRSGRTQYEQYEIFVEQSQQDLLNTANDYHIENEHVQKWIAEWRTERLTLLQQWLPLIQALLQHEVTQKTVRATLECLAHYQEQIDQFYLKSRLSVYTKFAFTANGSRLEQLEKDSELMEINYKFMQSLQDIIFSLQSDEEKLWISNYSKVWLKHTVQEIEQHKDLLDLDDRIQFKKLYKENFANYLDDAKRYSEALEQRNRSIYNLIFKMRKALNSEK